jgi:ribosome-associated heat shock protein Hsp15
MDRQRIDKWLWYARMVRTRSAAAGLAASGHVRLNGKRIDAASRAVRVGDVITLALDRSVRVLKVTGFAERRGAFAAARLLYDDLSPPAPTQTASKAPVLPVRDPGSGRPTKRERRATDRFIGPNDD